MSLEAAAKLLGEGYFATQYDEVPCVAYGEEGFCIPLDSNQLCGALLDKLAQGNCGGGLINLPDGAHDEREWLAWCVYDGDPHTEVNGTGPTRLAAVLELVGKLE